MKIGSPDVGVEYAMRVAKLAQHTMKQQGEAALALIKDVPAQRPVGPNGEGSIINTTA